MQKSLVKKEAVTVALAEEEIAELVEDTVQAVVELLETHPWLSVVCLVSWHKFLGETVCLLEA
jgi:hypothetical protein